MVGNNWRAYVAQDGRTANRVVDEQTAKKIKTGELSMGDLISKIYPNGTPAPQQGEQHSRGLRR